MGFHHSLLKLEHKGHHSQGSQYHFEPKMLVLWQDAIFSLLYLLSFYQFFKNCWPTGTTTTTRNYLSPLSTLVTLSL